MDSGQRCGNENRGKKNGGILSAGDEATYTTDSTGEVTAEFKKDSLPGDEKGNIVLAAVVEDNDQYGNLQVEKTVSWGVPFNPDNSFFNQRALWSTRSRTPILAIVYGLFDGINYLGNADLPGGSIF